MAGFRNMRKNILLDHLRCRGAGIVLSAVLMVSASAAGDAESAQERYEELVRQKNAAAIVNGLIDAYATESAGMEIDAAGELLGQCAEVGAAVLDILSRGSEANCDALGAELLVWMARGDETPRWKRRDREVEPVLMATDEVGRRAAELLDHGDPFVRGLAEWAIAIRIGMENAGPLAVWPTEEAPGWYDKWIESLDGEFLLESDYARQGAVLGVHRSNAAIAKSAAEIRRRTRAMAMAVRDRMDSKTTRRLERQLEHFEAVYSRLVKAGDSGDDDPARQRRLWMKLRLAGRRVALMNPDLDFGHILLATRHAYHDGPNITAGAKPYIIKPGGDLLVKSGFGPGDAARPLIDGKLAPGHMRGMELWWDADRIVFSYAAQPRYFEEQLVESDQGFDDKVHGASEPAHIHEIRISGDGLRQITDHPFNSDVEPAYLPNGDIIFCSDRANYGSQCSGSFLQNKKIVNLYRVRADGTGIRAFHNNKDFDRYPHVLDNGLIVYTRWEYQERHLYQTHNVWTTRPDGTMTDALYKEHINSGPMALRDPRQVPGSHKLVAIACGHHEYAQGAVTVIDHHIGVNEHEGMRIVTPRISPREGGIGRGRTVAEGGIEDRGGLYQQPYALSDRSFLVSYSYHLPRSESNATNFGVYYIDVWGNKELIHREPVLSSVYPIALRKRPRPPIIRDGIEKNKGKAQCYVNDVYRGLDGVERGTVKYIRIAHRTEQPTMHTGDGVTEFNHLHYVPDGSWARVLGVWTWTPARVIGIVPVEEDGSAYFDVPANVPLYFQALDENYMEIRRMRSFVSMQPGEVRGCKGCHETRNETPRKNLRMPLAVRRAPSRPEPPFWGDTVLPDYEMHVQPILSKHCAGCHGTEDPAGGLEFTDRLVEHQFQSYRTMFGISADERTPVWSGYNYKLSYPEAEPMVDKDALRKMEKNEYPGQLVSLSNRFSDASISQPMEFGSHKSRLITALLTKEHRENVHMSRAEWIGLTTWVDLNAPYWGSFVDKEPVRRGEKPKRVFVEFPPPFESEDETKPAIRSKPASSG